MYPGFVTCNDAIQKILAFPVKTLLQLSATFISPVPVKSGKLSWYPACANFSKMQMSVKCHIILKCRIILKWVVNGYY